MRHSQETKTNVRLLRKKGLSLSQIKEKVQVPLMTIQSWVSDIKLTEKQKKILAKKSQKALQEGRIRAQKRQRKKRKNQEKKMYEKGIKEIGNLNNRELLTTGVALYWAEGFKNKHERRLGFCNSDPEMIKFYIVWLSKALKITKDRFIARVALNSSYKNKFKVIGNYWSKITGIPLTQFTKPFYQNTQWKKQFDNNNYHGVLRIHVKESLNELLKMRGWIEGLKLNI